MNKMNAMERQFFWGEIEIVESIIYVNLRRMKLRLK